MKATFSPKRLLGNNPRRDEMQKSGIVDSLIAFITREILQDERTDLQASTLLLEEGLLDSFSVVNLLSFIESELGVKISLEDMTIERFENIDTLADFVIESALPQGA